MKTQQWKVFPGYALGLAVMALTAWATPHWFGLIPNPDENTWGIGIGIAVASCILAVVAHKLAKGRTFGYIISYLLNAIGSGLAIGTLYWEMQWSVGAQTLALALLPSAGLGLALCLSCLGEHPLWRKVCDSILLLLTVALIGAAIVTWVKWDHVGGSFAFFCGVCQLFFHMACLIAQEKPEGKWRYLSFSGFWAFAVIAVVVVIILSEGDILDGLDIGGGEGKKKKAKNKV